ncbi:MAG: ABC transporter permease [Gemmatimonas sp.]
MQILRAIWFRLRSMLQPTAINAEFAEELRFHIERETQENIKRGMNPDDARRTAHAQFGGVERFKENVRDEHGVRWLDDLSADVRHGVRLLRKNTLFSFTVIVTLMLGIGATSTIFAIVNGVLLRPLPYPNADRIVSLSESNKGVDQDGAGQLAVDLWMQGARSFSAIAQHTLSTTVFTGQGDPIEINGAAATGAFFSVMGMRAVIGRTFNADDAAEGAPRVVVLSYPLWQNMFGGDSTIINRVVSMSGRQRTVIGVMPRRFAFPAQAQYWIPFKVPNQPGSEFNFSVLARLRDGVGIETAQRDLRGFVLRVDSVRKTYNIGATPSVMTLHDRLFGSVRKPLSILLAAVVVLLLIACANVANLVLARSASRQREFAVRLALGAGRWRLVRQLLVESSILAFIGGALGAIIPVVLVGGFVRLSPASVAGVSDIKVDGMVLLFTAFISIVAALLFGLAPALTGARSGPSAVLGASTSKASSSRAERTVRASLVVFEVAAALTLLTGAALLATSFSRAISVNPGFTANNVYSAYFSLPSTRYPEDQQQSAFYARVADELRGVPGIDAVSLSGARPLGGWVFSKQIPRVPNSPEKVDVAFSGVDANYARAAGLHLVAGRFIDATDVIGAPRTIMITKGAAHLLFPGQTAVGKSAMITVDSVDMTTPPTIVGVVEDVAQTSLDVKPMPQIFLPMAQRNIDPRVIVMRTGLSETVVRGMLKNIVLRIDPLQPVSKFYAISKEVERSVAPRRFNSILVNAFAGLALVLAVIGLYGLMANAVNARTRELGIRMALGAQSSNVLRLVMKQGAWLVFTGIVLGAMLSLTMSRSLSSMLYDVPAQDPTIFVGAALSLAAVALLACYIPARRATRVNPMSALRQD